MMLRTFIIIAVIIQTSAPRSVLCQSPISRIEGKVIDQNGEPIPFVNIEISQKDTLKIWAKSDINGRYRTKSLEAGNYTLEARRIGYAKQTIDSIMVRKNIITELNIILRKPKIEEVMDLCFAANAAKEVKPIFIPKMIQLILEKKKNMTALPSKKIYQWLE